MYWKKVKNFFALEKNIVAVIVANLFWVTVTLYKGFLPKFYESLGASIFFVGLLISLGDLFYGISSFIGGHLSDTHGRKYVFVRATLVANFILLGYFFAPNWIFLIPVIIFGSLFTGMEDASMQTLITESVPKKIRATALASVYLTATVFSTFLVIAGASLIQSYGILQGVRIGIIVAFFFSLAGTIIFIFHSRETFKGKPKKKKIGFSLSKIKNFFLNLPANVKGMLLFLALLYFSNNLAAPYFVFYSLDIIKIDALQFGILAGVQFITVAFFTFVGAKLSDKYGRKKILLISIILSSTIPVLFVLSNNFVQLVFVYILSGISTLGFSTIFAYITDNIDAKRRARAIGVSNGLMVLVGIPAPLIGSLLYTAMPQWPFLFSSLLLVVNLIVGIKFLK
jgi:MFS family permease